MNKNPPCCPLGTHSDFSRPQSGLQSSSATLVDKDMKPVPLLLLLSSVLFSSHLCPTAGRPHSLPGWMLPDSSTSELLNGNVMKLLQNRSQEPLSALTPEEETEDEAVRAAAQLLKRSEGPPLSIDLPLTLVRKMLEMTKQEKQREQALLNRKVLDEIGK